MKGSPSSQTVTAVLLALHCKLSGVCLPPLSGVSRLPLNLLSRCTLGGRGEVLSNILPHLQVPPSGWVGPGLETYRTPEGWEAGGYGSRKLGVLEACGWAAGALRRWQEVRVGRGRGETRSGYDGEGSWSCVWAARLGHEGHVNGARGLLGWAGKEYNLYTLNTFM